MSILMIAESIVSELPLFEKNTFSYDVVISSSIKKSRYK